MSKPVIYIVAGSRIKQRVKQGGHNVASVDVRRRFKKSRENFLEIYKPLAERWYFFDNSGVEPQLICSGLSGRISVADEELYKNVFGKMPL